MSRRQVASGKRRDGFAIILVSVLAAMMVLLAAALLSFTQIESAALLYDQHVRIARNNARSALEMAVGDLQIYAGQDRVATMLADTFRTKVDQDFKDDVTDIGVNEPFWTGVWNVDGSVNWLVTRALDGSQSADPVSFTGGVTLIGSSTAQSDVDLGGFEDRFNVTVPSYPINADKLVSFGENQAKRIGNYAYWVGDLGVKASFGLIDRQSDIAHGSYTDDENNGDRTRLDQMFGQVYDHRQFNADYVQTDEETGDVYRLEDRLAGIKNDFQFRQGISSSAMYSILWANNSNDGLRFDQVQNRFHDYTFMHRGVLADTLNGGLKKDLSRLSAIGDPLIDNELLPYCDVASLPVSIGSEFKLRRTYQFQSKVDGLAIAPVLTEFHIDFVFKVDRATERLLISYSGIIELWNPYTSQLTYEKLKIGMEKLPQITLNYKSGSEKAVYVFPLDQALGANLFVLPDPIDGENWWRPGQTIAFSGGRDLETTSGFTNERHSVLVSEELVSLYIDGTPAIDPVPDETDLFSIEVPQPFDPVVVVRNSSDKVLARYSVSGSNPFEAFSFGDLKASNSSRLFGMSWAFGNPDSGWAHIDPRREEIPLSALKGFNSDPKANSSYNSDISEDVFFRENFSSNIELDTPIFELPRQELLSVASLQHAQTSSGFRYQLGRSTDELGLTPSINRAFDEFFFSTVPQADTGDLELDWDIGEELGNPRLLPRVGVTKENLRSHPDQTASNLMLMGAFNINSTSIDAWESVLRSTRLGGWEYAVGSEPGNHDFGGDAIFAKYSQSAEETWEGKYEKVENGENLRQYRQGIRNLNDSEINSLATAIVSLLRVRGASTSGPFSSVSEFVDDGLLREAIASANLNFSYLPEAPSFLNQADILTHIAPFISTRSDTFLVRAYGDSVNPRDANKVLARAYCEAIVQRLPDKHSTDAALSNIMSATSTGSGELGRQFKIVAFRWMSGSEI